MRASFFLVAATLLTACSPSAAPPLTDAAQAAVPDAVMAWPALLNRPRPTPARTIPYGTDSLQVADLWLPATRANTPIPTVLMIHGGCWTTEIADRSIMNWIAADLAKRGYAVWNIDYRGVDRPGGGYPGTFQDVAAAADALHIHAADYNLDLTRLVAVGHSAGGHLALWLAARPRLPAGSPLRTANPLLIAHVVSLGGLQDLEQDRAETNGCGAEVIDQLVGLPTNNGRDPYADTSLPRLAPIGVPHTMINGNSDRIIPTHFAAAYAAKMRAKGDTVTIRIVPGQGHVELIAPETPAWGAAVDVIEAARR